MHYSDYCKVTKERDVQPSWDVRSKTHWSPRFLLTDCKTCSAWSTALSSDFITDLITTDSHRKVPIWTLPLRHNTNVPKSDLRALHNSIILRISQTPDSLAVESKASTSPIQEGDIWREPEPVSQTVLPHNVFHSWFQTFAVFWIVYAFFWVFPRRPIVVCRRFGTLYLFHLHGLDVEYSRIHTISNFSFFITIHSDYSFQIRTALSL